MQKSLIKKTESNYTSERLFIHHDQVSFITGMLGWFNVCKSINVIKTIHGKPVTNIILNGEKLKPFPLKSGTRQKPLDHLNRCRKSL
jgi:hypothetical protein